MSDCRRSLLAFVESARDRAQAYRSIYHWAREAKDRTIEDAEAVVLVAEERAREVCELCLGGNFREAVEASREAIDIEETGWEIPLLECAAWTAFHEALHLAERIDSFLTVLERQGVSHHLARDCRGDLDVLLVLADWCHDNGMVQAAAEARHLHRALGRS